MLYFVVIDLGNTNHMYNVSLKQFMKLFLKSIEISKVIKEKTEDDEEEEVDTSVRVQQIYEMRSKSSTSKQCAVSSNVTNSVSK